MGTFGRLVFCEVRTQIVGKTIVFRQSYIGYFRNRPGAMPTLLAEAVDEVFLAVVAGGVGDLLDRERGRGQHILRLVDAAEDDVLIGRIAGPRLELPREMRWTQS